jgi:hypothetical protein
MLHRGTGAFSASTSNGCRLGCVASTAMITALHAARRTYHGQRTSFLWRCAPCRLHVSGSDKSSKLMAHPTEQDTKRKRRNKRVPDQTEPSVERHIHASSQVNANCTPVTARITSPTQG